MKNTIIVLATALAIVGCRQNNEVNEPSGSQKESINQSTKAQKDALNQQKKEIEKSASATKKDISESAGAQKERVEAEADAAKANLTAQEKKIEAEAKAAKAEADAQAKAAKADAKASEAQANAAQADTNAQAKISESAGAQSTSTIGTKDQATSDSDRAIVQQIRQSFTSGSATSTGATAPQPQSTAASSTFENVTIVSQDGAVTLKGTVQSDAEKSDIEAKCKAVSGVKSVDNQLQVKAQ